MHAVSHPLSQLEALDDLALLRQHLAGDPDAFEVFVRRYHRPLYAFLVRFTASHSLADDVFQETFLKVHSAAKTLHDRGNIKSWLFTVAANSARDALRSRTRRAAMSLDQSPDDDGGRRRSFGDLLTTKNMAPEELSVNRETREAVLQQVSAMEPRLREVLALSYLTEMTQVKIAELLDIPLGTVKSRLHQAVKDFAERWRRTTRQDTHQ